MEEQLFEQFKLLVKTTDKISFANSQKANLRPLFSAIAKIPNNELNKGQQNINFNINAVDASGVQELLVEQRGNIIEMIREAANDTGEYFLEQVDTQSMGGSGSGY